MNTLVAEQFIHSIMIPNELIWKHKVNTHTYEVGSEFVIPLLSHSMILLLLIYFDL